MRVLFGFTVLLWMSLTALGVDITTADGTLYRNATVTAIEPDGLHIMHSSGVTKVPFENLPTNLQKKYHYDPQKAQEYSRKRLSEQSVIVPRNDEVSHQQMVNASTPANIREAGETGEKRQFAVFPGASTSAHFGATRVESPSPQSGDSKDTAPNVATSAVSQPASGQFAKAKNALLIVSGDVGAGSGFLGKYNGDVLVFTNAHVVSGNKNLSVRRITNEPVQLKQMAIARDFDVAAFSQTNCDDSLAIAPKVEEIATLGDEVAVLGNSLGAGVVTELHGKITGIGPEFIEIDAKFVVGNSGSPVIHLKSGMVIGIATLLTYRELKTFGKDSPYNSIERRFAQRIDTLPAFEATSPSRFAAEADIIKNAKEHTDNLVRLGHDIFSHRQVTLDLHQDPNNRLARPVRDFLHDMAKFHSKGDLADTKARFARQLVFETKADLFDVRPDSLTSYHKKLLQEEIEKREVLRTAFETLVNIQTGDRLINLP